MFAPDDFAYAVTAAITAGHLQFGPGLLNHAVGLAGLVEELEFLGKRVFLR